MKDEKLYGVYRIVAIQKVNYLGLFKVILDVPNGKSTLKRSDDLRCSLLRLQHFQTCSRRSHEKNAPLDPAPMLRSWWRTFQWTGWGGINDPKTSKQLILGTKDHGFCPETGQLHTKIVRISKGTAWDLLIRPWQLKRGSNFGKVSTLEQGRPSDPAGARLGTAAGLK